MKQIFLLYALYVNMLLSIICMVKHTYFTCLVSQDTYYHEHLWLATNNHIQGICEVIEVNRLPVEQRIHFKLLLTTFKALRGQAPDNTRDIL